MLTIRPNSALGHSRHHALDQRDRRQHVRFDPVQYLLAGDFFELGARRPAVVVHQNVGRRTGFQQDFAHARVAEIARHRDHFGAGRGANFRRRRLEANRVAPVDDDAATRAGEFHRAGAPQALARSANDRAATCNAQIHR